MRRFPFRPLLLAAALTGLAGCAVNPATGRTELALIPVSTQEEIALGRKAFPQAVQQMGGAYPDARLEAYVNEVGMRLGRASQRPDLPYQFRVVNDSSPNAFALPGGYIAVTRGLLVNLENEEQLAAILGHEVGHVAARHSVQGIQRETLLNLGLTVLSGVAGGTGYGTLVKEAGAVSAELLERSYSRDQERESDRLGIDYMVKAGYNPMGAVQVQEFFYRQLEGGAQPQWLSGLFRTHPFSKERLDSNANYIRATYPQTLAGPLRPEPLKAASVRIQASKKGYELFDKAVEAEGTGNVAQALTLYQQAATAAPDESLILTRLGMTSLKANDAAGARRHLARAVQLDGNYYLSRLGLGYLALQQGESQKAVTELESSMKLLPTLRGAYLLGEGYEKTGRRQEALDLYRAVSQADPNGELGKAASVRVKALGG